MNRPLCCKCQQPITPESPGHVRWVTRAMDDDLIPDPEVPEIRIPREHQRGPLLCPDHGPTVALTNESCTLPDAYCVIDEPHCTVPNCGRTDVARGVSTPKYVYSAQEHRLEDVAPFDSWMGHRPLEGDDCRWTSFHASCGQPSNVSEAWESDGWFTAEQQADATLHEGA